MTVKRRTLGMNWTASAKDFENSRAFEQDEIAYAVKPMEFLILKAVSDLDICAVLNKTPPRLAKAILRP